MAYVIAFESENRLYNKIMKLKNLAEQVSGNQQYLKNEPHLTLYVANFENLPKIKIELENFSKNLKKTKVKIKGWFVFKNDVITKRDTIICELDNKTIEELRSIQLNLILMLNKYRKKELLNNYEKNYKALGHIEQSKVDKYGFPFIGDTWLPHFSIASFEKKIFGNVWEKLKELCPKGSYEIVSLNLYSLEEENENMKLLEKYPLS